MLTTLFLKHPLITKIVYHPGELVGLAWFALHSTKTFWSYAPWKGHSS